MAPRLLKLVMIPRISEEDPDAEGEGRLDPLRLSPQAFQLAEFFVPDTTARMQRIRALTFMAVNAHVCEPFRGQFTEDGITPSWLAFEWMYAEAMAREGVEKSDTPGVGKARTQLNKGGRLSAGSYLKSARALGLHAFYRPLAEGAGVIDAEGRLDQAGGELLFAWEKRSPDLKGFAERAPGSRGNEALKRLEEDLGKTLALNRSALVTSGRSSRMPIMRHLLPDLLPGPSEERTQLRAILDSKPAREETLTLIEQGLTKSKLGKDSGGREIAGFIRKEGSSEHRRAARALIAHEEFSQLVTEAFELLKWRSSQAKGYREPEELTTERIEKIADQLPAAVEKVRGLSEKVESHPDQAELLEDFGSRGNGSDLIEKLLARHEKVQSEKGKRTFFEAVDSSGVWIRPAWTVETEPEASKQFLHPVRLENAKRFLIELDPR